VYAAAIFSAKGLRDVGKKALVDVVGDEWSEGSQSTDQSVENFEKRIEGYTRISEIASKPLNPKLTCLSVIDPVFALKPFPVKADVPIFDQC
jgi:hypothetical protein